MYSKNMHGTPIRQQTRGLVQAILFAIIWKRKNLGQEWAKLLVAMREIIYKAALEEMNQQEADEIEAIMEQMHI